MIHVENADYYTPIISLAEILVPDYLSDNSLKNTRLNRFSATREIINRIETAATQNKLDLPGLKEQTNSYNKLLEQYKLKNKLFESPPPSGWMLIVFAIFSVLLLPFHLYGMIFNYLPYKIPALFTRKIKDPQFISSLNFGLGFVTFLVWYLILLIVLLIFSGSFLITVAGLISFPFAGLFTFYHYRYLKKLGGKFRLVVLKNRHPEKFRQLIDLRQHLRNILS